MATQTGQNIGIVNNYAPGDNGWSSNMNFVLRWIDTLLDGNFKSASTTAPPGSPAEGDTYIIPAGATGAWSSQTNKLTRWSVGLAAWEFLTPKTGWGPVWIVDSAQYLTFNGSSWVTFNNGFTGGTLTSALNEAPTVTLASASTVNIGAAAGNTISVTGTTTITAFDTIAAGAVRRLVFSGALTLTYNATSLILPGSANITTAAGDAATFLSLGSGNWRCVQYQKADGTALVAASSGIGLNSQTGTTYTLVLGDAGLCVEMNNASANTLTVPPNSSVAFPIGTNLIVRQMGAGQTAVAAGAGVTIRTAASLTARVQYSQLTLHKRATDEWVLGGDMT